MEGVEFTTSTKRLARDWSDSQPQSRAHSPENVAISLETGETSGPSNKTIPISTSSRQKRTRVRKNKGKRVQGSTEPKDERQARSYVITDGDLALYNTKHRVSDDMFKHYLNKRIGFECTKKKKRLNKKEVKNLFSPVRSLCLELLAQVKVKKSFNKEKKIVIGSVQKSTNTKLSWSDIVKGKKAIPVTDGNILVAAKDDKIKRQAEKIKDLTSKLNEKEKEITSLMSRLQNLTDRIIVLERNESSRRTRDPFSDLKKLASKGSCFCQECLPPTAFSYKKPLLVTSSQVSHGERSKMCENCKKVKVYLSSGNFIPIFSYNNEKKVFYTYPEGYNVLNQFKSEMFRVYSDIMRPICTQVKATSNASGITADVFSNISFQQFGVRMDSLQLEDGLGKLLKKLREVNTGSSYYTLYTLAARNNLIRPVDFVTPSMELGLIQ
jgi:hypothetical protein